MKAQAVLIMVIVLTLVAKCEDEPPSDAPLEDRRNYMLRLINDVRNKTDPNLPILYIEDKLNEIAQAHSVDMVVRKFFGHTNPSKQGSQDRAYAAGFLYPVGENVAYSSSLSNAHTSLMTSQPHVQNTVNPDWTRVGMGMYTDDAKGQVYVTILFSMRDIALYPLTDEEMQPVINQLDSYITTKNNFVKTKSENLSTHIKNWLVGGMVPSTFSDYLRNKG